MGQDKPQANRLYPGRRTFRVFFADKPGLDWWDRFFTRPGLRHVYCLTKDDNTGCWVYTNWGNGHLESGILFGHELRYLSDHTKLHHGVELEIEIDPEDQNHIFAPVILYCVALVRHQLGLPITVLTPYQLFKSLLARGAVILGDYREKDHGWKQRAIGRRKSLDGRAGKVDADAAR